MRQGLPTRQVGASEVAVIVPGLVSAPLGDPRAQGIVVVRGSA